MQNEVLYDRSRQPRYMQAAGQLRLKIERGEWLPGGQIPTIEALQSEFGLSRATIREALDLLADEGMIDRFRGRGTFVRAALPLRQLHSLPTSWAELVVGLESVRPTLVSPVTVCDGSALRNVLCGLAMGEFAAFQRVHSRAGEPYCLIDIRLRRDVHDADPERFREKPVISVLAARCGDDLAQARQRVTFSNADTETAQALGIALGAPVVEILRTVSGRDGRVISHTYARYPGAYVRLDFDFDVTGDKPAA
jgi:GntR family transcriptional regulator